MKPRSDLSGTAAAGTLEKRPCHQRAPWLRRAGGFLFRAAFGLVKWSAIGLLLGAGLVVGIHIGRPLLYGACASIMHVGVFSDE